MTTTRLTLADLATLDARRGSADFDIASDGSHYTVTRLFGAPPARIYKAFTDPADLRQWFTAGAPDGSELTTVESDPVVGGRYHYVMEIPEMGTFQWHGAYTATNHPEHIGANEWFVMGDAEPEGPPSVQTLDFEAVDGGGTWMTMRVTLGEAEDPEVLMEQTAGGLGSSLDAIDRIVSG